MKKAKIDTLENLNSLDEISDTQIKIENIIIKVEEFDKNLAKSNNLILEKKLPFKTYDIRNITNIYQELK